MALHWINPLVWRLRARLRRESELACDDALVQAGLPAREYARELLDFARLERPAAGVNLAALVQEGGLESRVRAILDPLRRRRPRAWLAAGAAVTVLLLASLLAGFAGVGVAAEAALQEAPPAPPEPPAPPAPVPAPAPAPEAAPAPPAPEAPALPPPPPPPPASEGRNEGTLEWELDGVRYLVRWRDVEWTGDPAAIRHVPPDGYFRARKTGPEGTWELSIEPGPANAPVKRFLNDGTPVPEEDPAAQRSLAELRDRLREVQALDHPGKRGVRRIEKRVERRDGEGRTVRETREIVRELAEEIRELAPEESVRTIEETVEKIVGEQLDRAEFDRRVRELVEEAEHLQLDEEQVAKLRENAERIRIEVERKLQPQLEEIRRQLEELRPQLEELRRQLQEQVRNETLQELQRQLQELRDELQRQARGGSGDSSE